MGEILTRHQSQRINRRFVARVLRETSKLMATVCLNLSDSRNLCNTVGSPCRASNRGECSNQGQFSLWKPLVLLLLSLNSMSKSQPSLKAKSMARLKADLSIRNSRGLSFNGSRMKA